MGILRYQDVADWQHAATNELRDLARDPDDAGPIGRRAGSPIKHTATWIGLDRVSGKLTYGPETEIEVYRGHEKLLPKELQEKLGTREIRGWLFQVRKAGPNPQPDSFALLDGKEILLSKLPHSRNYFVRRTLKPCKHEKAVWAQVERAWDKYPEMYLDDERLDRVLQDLSATPFVGFKECRAAWSVTPKRFDVLGRERFDTLDDYTIAALALPFEQAYDWLIIDPAIQQALDLTESGCLFLQYQSAKDVKAAILAGFRPPKGPVRFPVTEGLCENSGKLMEAACWAALCGREVPAASDSVAESAVLLYYRFAYNFVDREKHPVVRSPRISRELGSLPQSESLERQRSESFGEAEKTRDFTAQWWELGDSAAVGNLMLIIDRVLQADEDQIDEEFAATLRPPLEGWPPGWKRPAGLDHALRRLNKLDK